MGYKVKNHPLRGLAIAQAFGMISVFFGLSIATASVAASELQTLPQVLSVAGEALQLNGSGVRKKAFITVYDAGLYLPEKSQDAASILAGNEAVAVVMVMRSKLATGERMAEAIRDGFVRSIAAQSLSGEASLSAEVDAVVDLFSKLAVVPGDKITIESRDGVTTSFHNQKMLKKTNGAVFRQAVFGIWLSQDPIQSSLKSALLGQP